MLKDPYDERRLAESDRRGWSVPLLAIITVLLLLGIFTGSVWWAIWMVAALAGWLGLTQWSMKRNR